MHTHTQEELEHIWQAVPPDYYQKGIRRNRLQRLWHTGKLNAVVAYLPENPGHILDVGSASGWFLNEVSKRFPQAKYTGIDVYKDAIAYAKKSYPHITFRLADGHSIPLSNNSVDVVMCNEVLEHVVDPELVLKEMKRVLSPTGTAIIEMDSGSFLFRAAWYWWTHLRHGVWEDAHIQVFNAKKLEALIKKCGFIITKKKFFNVGMAVVFQAKKSN